MFFSVRLWDLLYPSRFHVIAWITLASTLVLILDRRPAIRDGWRLLALIPQLCFHGVFLYLGLLSIAIHLPRLLLLDDLDGEWLHEGWPGMEAMGLWALILLLLTLESAFRLGRLWLRRARSRRETPSEI